MNNKKSNYILFLLGIFTLTRVYFLGCVAIAELVIFALAPFLLFKNFDLLRREKSISIVYMLLLLAVTMLGSSCYNHTPTPFVIKGLAVYYAMFSYYIVFYLLLRHNVKGLGWFFMGIAISSIITIFAFNPHANVTSEGMAYIGESDMEEVVNGPLFWVSRLNEIGRLPIVCSYLKTSTIYSGIFAPLGFAVAIGLLTSTGRSATMAILAGGFIILIGRRSVYRMKFIGKHFLAFVFGSILIIGIYKSTYTYLASRGILGEEALAKYTVQTRRGTGFVRILAAGRPEFFVGLTAAIDQPIIGFGMAPRDSNDYSRKYVEEYGDDEMLRKFTKGRLKSMERGISIRGIPSHSHIIGDWHHCGIAGLIFWVWVIVLLCQQLKNYMSAIPQWYGYFALTIPALLWDIFFSPLTQRHASGLIFACLMIARAVAEHRIQLSSEVKSEILKYAR